MEDTRDRNKIIVGRAQQLCLADGESVYLYDEQEQRHIRIARGGARYSIYTFAPATVNIEPF